MPALQSAIWTRLMADNGPTGLFANPGTLLVHGVFFTNVPANAPMPYLMVVMVGTTNTDTFRTRSIRVEFDVHTVVARASSNALEPATNDDGLIRGAAIMERIDGDWDRQTHGTAPTYGLDRYQFSLSGSTQWTCDICEFQECRDESDDESFHWVQTFRLYVSRAAV